MCMLSARLVAGLACAVQPVGERFWGDLGQNELRFATSDTLLWAVWVWVSPACNHVWGLSAAQHGKLQAA